MDVSWRALIQKKTASVVISFVAHLLSGGSVWLRCRQRAKCYFMIPFHEITNIFCSGIWVFKVLLHACKGKGSFNGTATICNRVFIVLIAKFECQMSDGFYFEVFPKHIEYHLAWWVSCGWNGTGQQVTRFTMSDIEYWLWFVSLWLHSCSPLYWGLMVGRG